jgi:hypothetical protein
MVASIYIVFLRPFCEVTREFFFSVVVGFEVGVVATGLMRVVASAVNDAVVPDVASITALDTAM